MLPGPEAEEDRCVKNTKSGAYVIRDTKLAHMLLG